MRPRPPAVLTTAALLAGLLVAPPAAADPTDPGPRLSELRIDQPGTDIDEYAEVEAPVGTDLAGLTLLAVGDGAAGSGVIESVVDLAGTVGSSRAIVVAEDTFTLGAADQVADLGFENSDNVTHVLVRGFTGADGDDLDTDDDGTLDVTPWTEVLDAVGLVESTTSGDRLYGAALGFADVGPDGSFVPGHVHRLGDAWAVGGFDPAEGDDTPGTIEPADDGPACGEDALTPIPDVQGDGDVSPYAGTPVYTTGAPVTVRGVVTMAEPSLGGFFVQDAAGDGDTATSDALFVTGALPADAAVGGTVEVTGGVRENFDRTQVEPDEVAVCDDAPTAITPTSLVLPLDAAGREPYESMLVATTQDLHVTSLYTAWAYGELGVALDGPLTQPTSAFAPDDPRAEDLRASNAEQLLFIDDLDRYGYANAPWFEAPRRAGDVVQAGVVGTLFYNFGDFLLEPADGFPAIVPVEERPDAPSLREGNDIASFNVLNYFNDLDGRGARTEDELALQTAKIVEAITALDPSVLGLIELENDYEDAFDGDPATVPAVQDLVDALNERAGGPTWDWVRPDADDLVAQGLGTDEIAVGIIYQPARATEVGDPATFDIDSQLTEVEEGNDDFSDGNKDRWPLAQSFRVDGHVVTVVVNHLKSKGSSCAFVDGPAFDPGDDVETALTGNCALTRAYAAGRLVDWVEDRPTGVRSPDTFVVGDLNSYDEEPTLTVFEDAGWVDAVERFGDDAPTYKFDGTYGRLDYVLASPSAARWLDDAAVWQANSPEPYGYLYDNEPIDTVATATPYASSDHDPVVVSLDRPRRRHHRHR